MNSKNGTKSCACGCKKFFVGTSKYAFEWHDPNAVINFQKKAQKFGNRFLFRREDKEDFVSYSVEQYIRRGYVNLSHLKIDYLRSRHRTLSDFRRGREVKEQIAKAIPIELAAHLLPAQDPDIAEGFSNQALCEAGLSPLSKWSQGMVKLWLAGVRTDQIRTLFQVDYKHIKWAILRFKSEYIRQAARKVAASAEALKPLEMEWLTI